MRVLLDMQALQSDSRYRGIGRYVRAVVTRLLKLPNECRFTLLFNERARGILESRDLAAFKEQGQGRIEVVYFNFPGSVNSLNEKNALFIEIAQRIREHFISALNPDVVHVCSLFEGHHDDIAVSINKYYPHPAVVCTLYDLIPLVYPDIYLPQGALYTKLYNDRLGQLKHAALLLTISDATRNEAIALIGLSAERLKTVHLASDVCVSPNDLPEIENADLAERFNITKRFVFCSGGFDPRKNVDRLIEAFAMLPEDLRADFQLIFAGQISAGSRAHLTQLAALVGLMPDDVLFLGYVSDSDLTVLYARCAVSVMPSWHEGFGLPALEAMSCRSPLIAGNRSSLPEIVGNLEALFDPFHIDGITKALERVLRDPDYSAELRFKGINQAARFSWKITAENTLEAYREVLSSKGSSGDVKSGDWRLQKDRLISLNQSLLRDLCEIARPLCNEDLDELAECLSENFKILDHALRFWCNKLPLAWQIEGPFDSSYSLAILNREMARAVKRAGFEVALHSTEGPGDFEPNASFIASRPDLRLMMDYAKQLAPSHGLIVSRNLYPPRVSDMHGSINLLHAYGWEETSFPHQWAKSFNETLQFITVMSQHVKKILRDSGVQIPIMVSGVGVDHLYRSDKAFLSSVSAKRFRFLHVSSCFPRKGVDLLIEAYCQAFRSWDDVCLVIKTFPNPHQSLASTLRQMARQDPGMPEIKLMEEDLSDGQLNALYAQCDVLVAPSRAEGFGLPVAEALIHELSVITTRWSGMMDFCDPDDVHMIDFDFKPAQSHFGLSASSWAEPRVDELVQAMKQLHQAPQQDRRRNARQAKAKLLARFSWDAVARRQIEALQAMRSRQVAPVARIAWVSTWGTRCGIANYSRHLLSHFPADVHLLAPLDHDCDSWGHPNVIRCWHPSSASLGSVSQALDDCSADCIVIQFNYGFFEFETLNNFILRQSAEGRVVLIQLHATVDPVHAPEKKLAYLRDGLRACERILVHGVADLNRLKALGLTDNVTLFPLGVLNPVLDLGLVSRRGQGRFRQPAGVDGVMLGTYGFFLPHKGICELIEALSILRGRGLNVKLRLVNAEYPHPMSAAEIQRAKSCVKRMELEPFVEFFTDYLDDKESFNLLDDVDLLVFPYQASAESASAAVRHGIASGKPVATTPLSIFADVSGAVHQLPGVAVDQIAQGLEQLIEQLSAGSDPMVDVRRRAEAWRAQHRYSQLGVRLAGMIFGLYSDRYNSGFATTNDRLN
jgi:glycosyltransferase involved in cell wall biosynthesis